MRDFHHSVNVLVKAYFNDTLVRADCKYCAVGNLISDGVSDYKFNTIENNFQGWFTACGLNVIHPDYRNPEHTDIIKSGYSLDELRAIERAFMHSLGIFEGLMAVVDVLADIHKIDLTEKEHAKTLFVR